VAEKPVQRLHDFFFRILTVILQNALDYAVSVVLQIGVFCHWLCLLSSVSFYANEPN
jgi:hypothetical protein